MSLLPVLKFPDKRLRQTAKPVETFDDKLKQLVEDMFQTMYEGRGIGLAATQVNIHQRIFVTDVSDNHDEPIVLINPEIIEQQGQAKYTEGCLSVPGIYEDVVRSAYVKIKAYDAEGKEFEIESDTLLGTCMQHEIDHLDGKLFIDHLSSLKRKRVLAKLKKLQRQTL